MARAKNSGSLVFSTRRSMSDGGGWGFLIFLLTQPSLTANQLLTSTRLADRPSRLGTLRCVVARQHLVHEPGAEPHPLTRPGGRLVGGSRHRTNTPHHRLSGQALRRPDAAGEALPANYHGDLQGNMQ